MSGVKPKCSRGEVGAGAGHARLDLVGDEDDAVGGAPVLERGEVAVGGHDEAALALDGLDDEAGQVGGPDRLLEVADGACGRGGAVETVVQRVGVGGAVHVAGEGAEADRVRHGLEVHRHGEVGAPVVGVLEHGDTGAAGVLAGDLDAVLDRFRARVHQHRLLGEVAGGVLGEQFGDAHVLLVGRDREEGVDDIRELRLCGRDDGVVGVADGGDTDAGAEVDELVAVDVGEDRSVRALDEHGERARHAIRDDPAASLLKLDRPGSGDRGDEAALLHERRYRGGRQGVGHGSDSIPSPRLPEAADSVAVACSE